MPFFDYITKVTVTVNITHTYDGDLSLSLIAPNATVIPLATRRGTSGDNFTATTFDDDATTPIASGVAPFTGSFKPESPLSVLAGAVSYGNWQLKAVDSAGADVGTIVDWSLSLSFPAAPCGASVTTNQAAYSCTSLVGITVKDTNVAGTTITVDVNSTTETTPETVTLTRLAAPQDTWFTGSVQLGAPPAVHGDGVLSVVNGDTITVSYLDADDGQGNTNVTVTTTATTQCVGPTISNVGSSNVAGSTAQINWLTNNPATSVVHYGLTIPPGQTASNAGLVTTHGLPLTGLTPCNTYYYSVESVDAFGNVAIDNNGGVYYNFTTLQNTNADFPSTDTPVTIPDNNTTGVTSTINVPDLDTVVDVNVTVNVQHTWDGDVTMYLIGPNGTQVTLVARRGSSGDNFVNTVFDDQATTPISSGTVPFTGSFKPELPLSALNGISAAGAWKLKATDSVTGDSGQILNWTLSLAYQPRVCGPSAQYFSHTFTDACASGGTGSRQRRGGPRRGHHHAPHGPEQRRRDADRGVGDADDHHAGRDDHPGDGDVPRRGVGPDDGQQRAPLRVRRGSLGSVRVGHRLQRRDPDGAGDLQQLLHPEGRPVHDLHLDDRLDGRSEGDPGQQHDGRDQRHPGRGHEPRGRRERAAQHHAHASTGTCRCPSSARTARSSRSPPGAGRAATTSPAPCSTTRPRRRSAAARPPSRAPSSRNPRSAC